jgi:hypothetical protein
VDYIGLRTRAGRFVFLRVAGLGDNQKRAAKAWKHSQEAGAQPESKMMMTVRRTGLKTGV